MKQFRGICAAAVVLAVCLTGHPTSAEEVEFLSKPQVIQAKRGDSVSLPCEFKGPADLIRLWYRDNSVLFVDNKAIFRRDHFKLDNGNLKVTVVGPEAAGEFQCRTNDPKESTLTHRIELLGPPKIDIDVDVFTVKEGGTIDIHCKSTSSPKPTISYEKVEGAKLENIARFVKDDALQIMNATRAHAGVYKCVAKNGYEPDDTKTVTVKYEGRPDVNVAIHWVSLKEPKAVEITCNVASEEGITVEWKKGADKIDNGGQMTIRTQDSKSVLAINNISEDLFDNYTCIASNTFGAAQDSVEISSVPIKPIVSVKPDSEKATFSLETVSPYPVNLFLVTYAGKNGKRVERNLTLSATQKVDSDGRYKLESDISGLKPDTDYEGSVVAVTVKNEKSAPAPFTFHTTKAAHVSASSPLTASVLLVCAALALLRA